MSSNLNFDSYSVLKNISLPSSTETFVNDNDKENKPFLSYTTVGGILLNSKYVWKANGSQFTIFNSKNGTKIASWNFRSANLTSYVKVTCVAELQRCPRKLPLLIIGLECGSRGQICIFNFTRSRVLRCIDIDYRVTSLCVIEENYGITLLSKALNIFDGIAAIGTSDGNVFLLNICQKECEDVLLNDVQYDRDEVNTYEVEIIYPCEIESLDVDSYRGSLNKRHILVHLNVIRDDIEHFVLKGPKGDNRLFVNKEEVIVSALHYCPQLASLLVGYNFGAWQLWNFRNLELVYTSPVYEHNVAVSNFAVQEPCDDPRAFCYIWTVYSYIEPCQQGIPIAVLYSLNYESKSLYEGCGIIYKNLTSCSVRFRIVLTPNEDEIENEQVGVSCLRLEVVNKNISKSSLGSHDEVIRVCAMVWNEYNLKTPRLCKTYLNLFDLNQWYKEQVPSSLNSKHCDSFTSRVCLTDMFKPISNNNPILDVRINEESLHQFVGTQKLEEHYYPSSLAFQIYSLSDNAVTIFSNQGKQRSWMSCLESVGPSILLKPADTFFLAINLGLTPLFMDTPNKLTTLDEQREFILSVALEQRLLGWLCKCVTVWSSGVYDSMGCSLNFLLTWGMQRAKTIKENADRLVVTLFDYSGVRPDENIQNLLSHCLKQLRNLSMLYRFVVRKYLGFVLNPDVVKFQSESLEMAFEYLDVLHWFLNVGLLPECPLSSYPKVDEFNRVFVPYPVEKLIEYYIERRTDLNKLVKEKFSSKESVLFIDNLIELECGGRHLQQQWENDGGSGTYPPVSLQALMRTYLLENVPIFLRHHVVAYLLLDLAMLLDQERYQYTIGLLIKFPSIFHLSPSTTKIIQSFWHLDHGNFETAVELLLDPMISSNDLKLWHHRLILNSLFVQDQYNFALLYFQARRPIVTDINDLCTIISLYVANNLIDEALHFQRQHQSAEVLEKLLHHFYKECDKIRAIKRVLFLRLQQKEEDAFVRYLKDVNHPEGGDLLVYYYTQRSRYLDAIKVNDSIHPIKAENKGLVGKQMVTDRDNIISHVQFVSNHFTKSIMDECKKIELDKKKNTQPKPFSVFIHSTDKQVKCKSSLIEAAIVKAKEIWKSPVLTKTPTKGDSAIQLTNEDIPFVCKPKATIPQSKVLTPLIYPKVRNAHEDDDEPPSKKFKLLSRLSIPLPETSRKNSEISCRNLSVRLNTPIVKRKMPRGLVRSGDTNCTIETPQSILKSQIHNLTDSSESIERNESGDTVKSRSNVCDSFINRNVSSLNQRSSFGLITPRRPLTLSPKPAVRFSFSRRASDSSQASTSSEPDFKIVQENALVHSPLEGTHTNDDLEISWGEKSNSQDKRTSTEPKNVTNISDTLRKSNENYKDSHNNTLDEISCDTQSGEIYSTPEPPRTPKSRRSYKEHSVEAVRSSPRLRKLQHLFKTTEAELQKSSLPQPDLNKSPQETIESVLEPPKTPRSRRSYKDSSQENVKSNLSVKKTRCLARAVLENNTYTKMVEKYSSISTVSTTSIVIEKSNEKEQIPIADSVEPVLSSTSVLTTEELNFNQSVLVEAPEVIENETSTVSEVDTSDSVTIKKIDKTMEVSKDVVVESIDDEVDLENDEGIQISTEEVSEVTSTMETDDVPETYAAEVNIYDDLSDGVYVSADPKMNIFDISDDLNLNEAISASDNVNTVEVETNSIYSANGGEVFADESDVLNVVPVNESSSEQPDSSSYVVTNNVVEEIYPSEAITELERNQSSDTSEVEIIELSSSGSVQEYSELENNSSRYDSSGDLSDESINSSESKPSNKHKTDDLLSSNNSSQNDDSNSSNLRITQEENLQNLVYKKLVDDDEDSKVETTVTDVLEQVKNQPSSSAETDKVENPLDDVITSANNAQKRDISIQTTALDSYIFEDENLLKLEKITPDETSHTGLGVESSNVVNTNVEEEENDINSVLPSSSSEVVILEDSIINIVEPPDTVLTDEETPISSNKEKEIVNIPVEEEDLANVIMSTSNSETQIDAIREHQKIIDEKQNIITGNSSGTVQVLIEEEQQLINTTAPTHEKKDNADTVIEHSKMVVTSASPTLDTNNSDSINTLVTKDANELDDSTSVPTEASKIAECQDLLESFFDSVVPCYSKASCSTDILNESVPVSDLNDSTNQHNLDDDSIVYLLENTPVLNRTKSFSSTMDNLFSPQLEKQSTPVRRSRRLSSLQPSDSPEVTDIRKYALRKSISSSQLNMNNQSLISNVTTPKIPTTESHPTKRKRSLSAHAVETPTLKRKLRGKSVDVEVSSQSNTELKIKKSNSTQNVASHSKDAINSDKSNLSGFKKLGSDSALGQENMNEYSSSRRLTRRQALLLEQALSNKSNIPNIPEIKATKHVKPSGESNADEDSISNSSRLGLRSSRSLSNSDASTTHSDSISEVVSKHVYQESVSTPLTSHELSSEIETESKNLPRKLRKRRLTSKDSDTSTVSETHSLIDVKKPARITRRTRSESNETAPPILRRSERNVRKSGLPKIVEEPNVESNVKTKGRKRK